ncbi:hypothetical protein [Streptomyces nojiriensis]|uniref:hypothetical protein n=1 Tax=Streptomyces nojiriensis TaxID=66374 RepID=UPI00399BF241
MPVGCWLSASVLDVVPGTKHATTTLTAVGLAGVASAAMAGWADWADLPPEQARVGLAHAASNVAAVACYTASLTARLHFRPLGERAAVVGGWTGCRGRQWCAGRARGVPTGRRNARHDVKDAHVPPLQPDSDEPQPVSWLAG